MTIKATKTCSNCGQNSHMTAAQTVVEGALRWYESYLCRFCGAAQEIDGTGFPPDDIRDSLLKAEGRWEIRLLQQEINKVAAMKVLRTTLDLSLLEAKQILGLPLSKPFFYGTRTEMLWLKRCLEYADIQAEIQPADDFSGSE